MKRTNVIPYSMDDAWTVAMRPGGSRSVVDLESGGYAVPVERSTGYKRPSRTKPIRAYVPCGVALVVCATPGLWRVVDVTLERQTPHKLVLVIRNTFGEHKANLGTFDTRLDAERAASFMRRHFNPTAQLTVEIWDRESDTLVDPGTPEPRATGARS